MKIKNPPGLSVTLDLSETLKHFQQRKDYFSGKTTPRDNDPFLFCFKHNPEKNGDWSSQPTI